MTDGETIAEIEALANAATPGPWEGHESRVYVPGGGFSFHGMPNAAANAHFIAACRTAIPALLTTVRKQQAEIERLRALTEWRPIESAPKDGRRLIFILTPSGFPQVAYSNTWWTCGFSVETKPTHWMPLPEGPP